MTEKISYRGMYGIGKNCNHFTVCSDKFLNHIFNCKQLDIHMLFYNEIVNQMDRASIGKAERTCCIITARDYPTSGTGVT